VHAAGTRDDRGLAVRITDETGGPVANAVVTFRLPEEGPGGLFSKGMRTEVVKTASDGHAAVQGIVWNRMPGAFQIRVTAIKEEIRAGTVVSQYVSNAPQNRTMSSGTSRKKWLAIAVIGAGAAAGLAVGLGGGSSSQSTGSGAAGPPPQIGTPTISIGRP
jgi:hypothetical protein